MQYSISQSYAGLIFTFDPLAKWLLSSLCRGNGSYSGLKSARAGSSLRLSSTGLQTRLAFAQYSLSLITDWQNESMNLNHKSRENIELF